MMERDPASTKSKKHTDQYKTTTLQAGDKVSMPRSRDACFKPYRLRFKRSTLPLRSPQPCGLRIKLVPRVQPGQMPVAHKNGINPTVTRRLSQPSNGHKTRRGWGQILSMKSNPGRWLNPLASSRAFSFPCHTYLHSVCTPTWSIPRSLPFAAARHPQKSQLPRVRQTPSPVHRTSWHGMKSASPLGMSWAPRVGSRHMLTEQRRAAWAGPG